ncbi:hypothetical protein VTN02DRAFT_1749 [Thermoascus thermophilus]
MYAMSVFCFCPLYHILNTFRSRSIFPFVVDIASHLARSSFFVPFSAKVLKMDYSVSRFKEGLENGHSFISGHSCSGFFFFSIAHRRRGGVKGRDSVFGEGLTWFGENAEQGGCGGHKFVGDFLGPVFAGLFVFEAALGLLLNHSHKKALKKKKEKNPIPYRTVCAVSDTSQLQGQAFGVFLVRTTSRSKKYDRHYQHTNPPCLV